MKDKIDVKDKIMSLFKKKITKNYNKPKCANSVLGSRKKQSEDKIIKVIEDIIIRDIGHFFE